jgi:hypothetical protein
VTAVEKLVTDLNAAHAPADARQHSSPNQITVSLGVGVAVVIGISVPCTNGETTAVSMASVMPAAAVAAAVGCEGSAAIATYGPTVA